MFIIPPAASQPGERFSASHLNIFHIIGAAWLITVLTGSRPAVIEPIKPANQPVAHLDLWKWWYGANEVTELEMPSVAARSPHFSTATIHKGSVLRIKWYSQFQLGNRSNVNEYSKSSLVENLFL